MQIIARQIIKSPVKMVLTIVEAGHGAVFFDTESQTATFVDPCGNVQKKRIVLPDTFQGATLIAAGPHGEIAFAAAGGIAFGTVKFGVTTYVRMDGRCIEGASCWTNGCLFLSTHDMVWRLPLELQIVASEGPRFGCQWKGGYTLRSVHDGQTVVALCTSGAMMMPGALDCQSPEVTKKGNVPLRSIHLANFTPNVGYNRKTPLGSLSYGKANEAPPWPIASPCIAWGVGDYIVKQNPTGLLSLMLVPMFTSSKAMIEEPTHITLFAATQMLHAALKSDNESLVISVTSGIYTILLEEIFAKPDDEMLDGKARFVELPTVHNSKFVGNMCYRDGTWYKSTGSVHRSFPTIEETCVVGPAAR